MYTNIFSVTNTLNLMYCHEINSNCVTYKYIKFHEICNSILKVHETS